MKVYTIDSGYDTAIGIVTSPIDAIRFLFLEDWLDEESLSVNEDEITVGQYLECSEGKTKEELIAEFDYVDNDYILNFLKDFGFSLTEYTIWEYSTWLHNNYWK